jgi:hypothetical protein
MSKSKVNCPLYGKIQKVHEKHYKIPKAFKLKGFVLLKEENDDILSSFRTVEDSCWAAFTNDPTKFLVLPNMEDSKFVVDCLGKPLIICAIHMDIPDFSLANIKVSPIFVQEPEPI